MSHNTKIIVAVDGFSSCGKSTFARELAARLGYIFIDTGAMYRAVTLYGIRHGAIAGETLDEERLVGLLPQVGIDFRFNPQRGASDIYLNGENVEGEIRGLAVSRSVSRVSGIGAVREKLVRLQQQMGQQKGIVMDGRDIGTVVFPEAELKIFMTADPEIRAQRRFAELTAKGDPVTLDEVRNNLRERDLADQTRAISPLRQAEDAIVLDNSRMTIADEIEWGLRQVRERAR